MRAPLPRAALLAVLGSALPAPAAAQAPDFQGAIARVSAVYGPRLAAEGVALSTAQGHAGTLTAWGERDAASAVLGIDEGYFADPRVSADGFLFALCHEMGHITGSAPRRPPPPEYDRPVDADGDMFVSAEGQADYYAAAKCMRLVLEGEDSAAYVRARAVPPRVAELCARQFPDGGAWALCQRIALAGLDFLQGMAIVLPVSFDTPSAETAPATLVGAYPARQCRLDTVLAGALCRAEAGAPTSRSDPSAGFCTRAADPLGARPACWFKE